MPEIFRPQNWGAVANTLHVTGRVEDDPRLLRLYNRFCLQGDRSITTGERAADRKLARLNGTRLARPSDLVAADAPAGRDGSAGRLERHRGTRPARLRSRAVRGAGQPVAGEHRDPFRQRQRFL